MLVAAINLGFASDQHQGLAEMSHRDRKDDRRRDPGPDASFSSSRRGLGSGRERERPNDHFSGRHERRRSRSASPRRRVDDRDRREGAYFLCVTVPGVI
jgi:hypothetical protein